jgi:NTE family protein
VRTAVVLGAGGLAGQAFHLGVLTALAEETGFDARTAEVVVGTSAGSLVAAALTAGWSVKDQLAMLLGDEMSPDAQERLIAGRDRLAALPGLDDDHDPPPSRLPLAPGALLAAARRPFRVRAGAVLSGLIPPGRNSTDAIRHSVARLHDQSWPGPQLRVCAVRARDARRIVFGTAGAPEVDVGTAVAASCAIPGYFTPVRINGEAFIDGGAHSPTNADVVARNEPELIVISSPMTAGRGGLRTADAALRLAVRRYLAGEVRLLRKAGAQVVVFQPTPNDLAAMGLHPMRMLRGADISRTAAASVRARLAARPELGSLLGQR